MLDLPSHIYLDSPANLSGETEDPDLIVPKPAAAYFSAASGCYCLEVSGMRFTAKWTGVRLKAVHSGATQMIPSLR